jgi:hypothetical protein
MKTDKTKLHHHRKSRRALHPAEPTLRGTTEFSELDLQIYRIERSPKQENL